MFQISLKTARELSGYTADEVAKYCGVSTEVYNKIEIDPSQIQLSFIFKIVTLYGASLNLIYPGTETDCIKHNRSQVVSCDHILTTQLSKNNLRGLDILQLRN